VSAWLTPVQVSERIGISVGTLANWRSESTEQTPIGPAYIKVGRLVRYDEDAVKAWQDSLAVTP
jgi:predicted DNA-binding transcriptional regulator AlpA